MCSRDIGEESAELWFFDDRPIQEAEQDRLNYRSVARVLSNSIESAKPPCMIGLLAEFGRGKSSTTNITAEMLRAKGDHDVVTVTADKHSGNARARNLVHGIAAELEQLHKIDQKDVSEILRPLRQATQVRAVDPTDTPWQRVILGRYSTKRLAISLLPFAGLSISLAALALAADGWAANTLTFGSGLVGFMWLLLFLFLNGPARPLGTPAKVTDQMPRAEAADEIEEVFGALIEHHRKKRRRRLVVIIDDIDRLSQDDLLDALRVLRSLQSVPRGQEPVFVISCNESILTAAVGAARSAPAPLPTGPALEDPDTQPPSEQQPTEEHTGHTDSHEDPALAFIDNQPSRFRADECRLVQEQVQCRLAPRERVGVPTARREHIKLQCGRLPCARERPFEHIAPLSAQPMAVLPAAQVSLSEAYHPENQPHRGINGSQDCCAGHRCSLPISPTTLRQCSEPRHRLPPSLKPHKPMTDYVHDP